jgi:hypothetical protein
MNARLLRLATERDQGCRAWVDGDYAVRAVTMSRTMTVCWSYHVRGGPEDGTYLDKLDRAEAAEHFQRIARRVP